MGLHSLFARDARSYLIDDPNIIAHPIDAEQNNEKLGDLPEYDVVIIGGGTAGCVLASRLSENRNVRVLLLEAGRSSRGLTDCSAPFAFIRNFHTDLAFNLWTEPQVNVAGAKKYWPRAKLLGGCSAMNAMMFHSGAPTDYDEWALSGQEGASGWTYNEFVRFFRKFEKFVPHPKFPNVDPSLRGTDGPVQVGFYGYFHQTTAKWIESCVKLGIPSNPDVNTSLGTLGVTKIMTYIDPHGKRVTMEKAYLPLKVLKRPNLKVALHAHVTRVLIETKGGSKRAVGVEFVPQKDGPRFRLRVKHEVVLSAGAICSPHILLLSGIGPRNHLAEHKIPLVHDLPGVGQNLQDHATVGINLLVKRGQSLSYFASAIHPTLSSDTLKTLVSLARWKAFGTGPLTTNAGEAAAFVRSDDKALFPPDSYEIKDMTSGSNAPDLETIFLPLGISEHGHGRLPAVDVICLMAVLLRPQSSGTITLKSANPFDAPLIDPKYLSTQNDVACLVRGLKLILRTAQTEPLASVIVHDDNPALDHNLRSLSDAELEAEVRRRVETLYHPAATCRMARQEDGGVVDPYLRVYGIENLRVADASIFPSIPSGHTTAPVIAVGEKAADIIKHSLPL